MSWTHIFVASGDSCPICLALAGETVPDGYRPHDGCTCNTMKMDDGERDCAFEYEEDEVWAVPGGFRISLTLTVTCPDGSEHSVPGAAVELDRLRSGAMEEFLEDVAHEACDQECDAVDNPFRCC